jgi:hypothetical protein
LTSGSALFWPPPMSTRENANEHRRRFNAGILALVRGITRDGALGRYADRKAQAGGPMRWLLGAPQRTARKPSQGRNVSVEPVASSGIFRNLPRSPQSHQRHFIRMTLTTTIVTFYELQLPDSRCSPLARATRGGCWRIGTRRLRSHLGAASPPIDTISLRQGIIIGCHRHPHFPRRPRS